MKQILLTAVMLLIINLPIHAKNKISMVTYFPVPYVAYSQVSATEQMDIGLTSTCDMKLGCSDQSATLNAVQVNLKGGKLNLDGGRGIKGNTLVLGNGMSVGQISFQNVRIQAGNMESVNANSMNVNALNLFGKVFPSCKAANGESGGQMQWANLKLAGSNGGEELYLVCGKIEASAADCSDNAYKLAHKSECCPKAFEDDNVCYSDCSGEDTYEWRGANQTVTDVLGADWYSRACSKDVNECIGMVGGMESCWDIKKLVDSLGNPMLTESDVLISQSMSCSKNRCDKNSEDVLCLVIFQEAGVHCLNGKGVDVTSSQNPGVYEEFNTRLYQCKKVPGETKRCKNGW